MLALRRKMLSSTATASLTLKLVDLALVSPQDTYTQIIELLATYSREALYSENNLVNTSVSMQIHAFELYTNYSLHRFWQPN